MSDQIIHIEEEAVVRLKRWIIAQEANNLKTKVLNDVQMVNKIKKRIEEEVQCCLKE